MSAKKTKFVSLHNHTEYSFLDGAIRVEDLVAKAKEFDMPAVAITDHGGLFGAAKFFEVCKKKEIKPILGFEAYVAPNSRHDKTQSAKGERNYSHLILLAENNVGWQNLMRLSTIGYTEGFYHKPRIDMEILREYNEGIIATSACAAGAIPQALIDNDVDKARKLALEFIDIFGKENFYFELQDHGLEEEKIAMPKLIALGRELNVPFIVANDAHYLRREDAPSHEILLCMQTKTTMDDPNRYKFSSDQVYFKSPEEMAKLFPDIPEAMENTVIIADRCNVDIKKKATLPKATVPAEFENDENYLTHLAKEGLAKKYDVITDELKTRLDYELDVINSMGFAGYFLIVRDFIRVAKDNAILVGCRGSAAGSLVAYSVDITDIDPLKFDLIFERFLNPERISMPDVDIDFADRDRQKIIDYVIEKYGQESVCQIINFGTLKSKIVVKDVARTLGVSVGEQNKLSSMITEDTLAKSYANNKELVAAKESNTLYKEVFKHAEVLEGLTRQPGMHAAGVIIAPSVAAEWAPLYQTIDKVTNKPVIMTQFDMNYVEKVGLVKMDFLGLRTFTVLQETLRLIEKYHNIKYDIWKLPIDDEKTYKLFGEGDTTGIFQFESNGMKDYLRKLKPSNIEDIIAMVALYRPGPMNNIDTFINRKYGREKISYPHPILENILNVTYGVIVYQEQVMRVAQVMGGFTLGKADVLRKAMGKKQADLIEELRVDFMQGAAEKGIDKKVAKDVYDLLAKFAEYGFNKSHAAVYAHLSYQSAFFKAHYPLEYMTGYLAAYLGDTDEFTKTKDAAAKVGIKMLPPDINKSEYEFTIEDGAIRIGLGAIKNVGKAGEDIMRARAEMKKPFTSIFDVCKNTDNRIVNKKALESLICAGAFDAFGYTRAQHFDGVAKALEYGANSQKERESGQESLFGGDDSAAVAPEPALPKVAPWPLGEVLRREKDILGFYASGHPLDQYADEIHALSDVKITPETMNDLHDGARVNVCGMIASAKQHVQKNGKLMGFAQLETFDAPLELIIFADAYERCRDMLEADNMVLVNGTILASGEAIPKLRVDSMTHLSQTRIEHIKSVHIKIAHEKLDDTLMNELLQLSSSDPNSCYLIIHIIEDDVEHKIRAGKIGMMSDNITISNLRKIFGKENVWLSKANS